MHLELDSMTAAADERLHDGVVAFLSEVISHRQLFERVRARFEADVCKEEIASDAKIPNAN